MTLLSFQLILLLLTVICLYCILQQNIYKVLPYALRISAIPQTCSVTVSHDSWSLHHWSNIRRPWFPLQWSFSYLLFNHLFSASPADFLRVSLSPFWQLPVPLYTFCMPYWPRFSLFKLFTCNHKSFIMCPCRFPAIGQKLSFIIRSFYIDTEHL